MGIAGSLITLIFPANIPQRPWARFCIYHAFQKSDLQYLLVREAITEPSILRMQINISISKCVIFSRFEQVFDFSSVMREFYEKSNVGESLG
jgi:hypothetical protein